MDRVSLTRPLLFSIGIGLLVYFLLPVGIMFVLGVLLSTASVLDPLHAKQHVRGIWTGLAIIAVCQMLFVLLVCPATSVAARSIAERSNGAIKWLIAAAAGVAIHWVAIALIGFPTYFVTRDEQFSAFALLFWLFTTVSGPFLMFICVALSSTAARRRK